MNLTELLKCVNGQIFNYHKNIVTKEIKLDSRLVKKNDIFIALNNNYIQDAIKNGTSLIITNQIINKKIPFILVSDIYQTILDIASYIRTKYKHIPLIAVTGSTGKTLTKEMLSHVLKTKYKVLKSEGNYNNHIGLPLTLFKLNNTYQVIIVELGMNHEGEIEKLSKVAKPDISIITNIGSSHIGNLGSIKKIKNAKLEIVNHSKITLTTFKNRKTKSVKKYKIKVIKNTFLETEFYLNNYHFYAKIPNILNSINIILHVSEMFNISKEHVLKSLVTLNLPSKRMNVIKKDFILIDDTYNASYESVINGINSFKNFKQKKLIILGDILELGKFSKKYHQKLRKLKKIKNATILTVGKDTKYLKAKHFNTNTELINYLKQNSYKDYIIYIKGSRKMHLEEIVNYFI